MVNQFLSLSLFLMLLSFFIVMNGMSGFENTKAVPVMNSVSMAFSNRTMAQEKAPSDDETLSRVINSGDVLEKVEALFTAEIASFEAVRNRFGNMMHVRVPVLDFGKAIDIPILGTPEPFEGGDDYVKGRGAFLPTLISMLKAEKHGRPYRLDMVLAVDGDPAEMSARDREKFVRGVGTVSGFARTLEDAGLPGAYISAALGEGKTGFIDLYFRPYEPLVLPDNGQEEARDE